MIDIFHKRKYYENYHIIRRAVWRIFLIYQLVSAVFWFTQGPLPDSYPSRPELVIIEKADSE